MSVLETPIEYLKGEGPLRAALLKNELQVANFQDLLHLFPTRYIDRTQYYKIQDLQDSSAEVQIIGRIIHLKTVEGKSKAQQRLVATFVDDTGSMELVWFRPSQWLKDHLLINVPYVIFGKWLTLRWKPLRNTKIRCKEIYKPCILLLKNSPKRASANGLCASSLRTFSPKWVSTFRRHSPMR